MKNNLIIEWEQAAKDLGLDIITNFILVLNDGTKIEIEMLLKSFGAKNGMLILSDYSKISRYKDEIIDLGFGFSVMGVPKNVKYDREATIGVLKDWGWGGKHNSKPKWL